MPENILYILILGAFTYGWLIYTVTEELSSYFNIKDKVFAFSGFRIDFIFFKIMNNWPTIQQNKHLKRLCLFWLFLAIILVTSLISPLFFVYFYHS